MATIDEITIDATNEASAPPPKLAKLALLGAVSASMLEGYDLTIFALKTRPLALDQSSFR